MCHPNVESMRIYDSQSKSLFSDLKILILGNLRMAHPKEQGRNYIEHPVKLFFVVRSDVSSEC